MSFRGPDYGETAAQQEQLRESAIAQGTSSINNAFSGFTPSFYQQRAQDYVNFAQPQLAQQYQTNRNQIGFGLANRNLLGSGAADQQWSNLARAMGQAQQQIADTGQGQANALQQQVENQRQTLYNQLYQSADPAGANQAAVQTAATYAQPSVFPAVGNLFTNLANQYYLSQLINAYRPNQASGSAAYLPPTYSAGAGSLPSPEGYY
jgi:hypothetical protein